MRYRLHYRHPLYLLLGLTMALLSTMPSSLIGSAHAQTPSVEGTPDAPDEDASPPAAGDTPDTATSGMTPEKLAGIIQLIDPDALAQGNSWQFQFQQRPMYLVFDPAADRMRLMTPIADTEALNEALMFRMLQANYDAVLDPRCAVAQGVIWSVFIHPLEALQNEQLASAVAQVYTAAETFGTTFSSGALIFGAGDSQQEQRRLLEELQKLLNPTT